MTALKEKTKRIAAAKRFGKLARNWKAETEHFSKVTKRVLHPAYQKIIGMGEYAIPLILLVFESRRGTASSRVITAR